VDLPPKQGGGLQVGGGGGEVPRSIMGMGTEVRGKGEGRFPQRLEEKKREGKGFFVISGAKGRKRLAVCLQVCLRQGKFMAERENGPRIV